MDPLAQLPSELILRIIEFTPTASLAALTRLNHSWNSFIDETHQEAIYSTPGRTYHPLGVRDFTSLKQDGRSFSKYYDNITSCKDLCRRQTLLSKNWSHERPLTKERIIRVGNDPIWRFRPDFQRRVILSTSHSGGLNVSDMDSGRLLWSLDRDVVRPFAHLEYADGIACWDCEWEGVEVWRIGREGGEKVKVLGHDVMTRGFQLSCFGDGEGKKWCLCVVSSEGCGFVYEGLRGDLELTRRITIPTGAVGHLDQDESVVVYSMGNEGYWFYEKGSGENLGVLDPEQAGCEVFFARHPDKRPRRATALGMQDGMGKSARDRTTPLTVQAGSFPGDDRVSLDEDEWGAGMLSGNLFVGVSRGGRLLVCPNWHKLCAEKNKKKNLIQIIDCDSDGSSFDLGGWLSVRDHRVMFEIQDLIYIIGLTDDDHVQASNPTHQEDEGVLLARPSFTTATSIKPQLANPVSFMGLYEDCIMSTYTTLHYRWRREEGEGGAPGPLRALNRIFQTKAVRVLSLAPELDGDEEVEGESGDGEESLPGVDATRAELHSLIAMLAEGEDDEGEDGG
ncbi:hypothetical protein M409DRAFT_67191 [Zasmidium cellare ATCC 36951]|uniref:F-box domain-containing protein n=1 Tax=Zasmidium cellare ATCC 36951 TaxID=1080233 RepID=A0A6A6CHA5_ZASCE|nr:uncharacterized protein M409DRAFT_67191 [Zasmidium cellare ATCC 36951]KAF2165322.1 hypothetical protein M409DRAFT_67191 [Zasmidium cellare ATCC 36951]